MITTFLQFQQTSSPKASEEKCNTYISSNILRDAQFLVISYKNQPNGYEEIYDPEAELFYFNYFFDSLTFFGGGGKEYE